MKAEHREELQTNTLADNLGRMIQGGRHMGRRTVLILVALALAGFVFFIWRNIQTGNYNAPAFSYYMLDQGSANELIKDVIQANPSSEPSKAAGFQIGWYYLWEQGIKSLVGRPGQARDSLLIARQHYIQLADECTNEPTLAAEAKYALALIEETLVGTELKLAMGPDQLDLAVRLYRQVADEFGQTAHGKLAAERADYLTKNRPQVQEFYRQMASRLSFEINLQSTLQEMRKKKQ